MTNTTISPPNCFSQAIDMAVADLRAIARNPHYRIDMSTWHSQNASGVCHVCFAGAVMANTLEVPIHQELSPHYVENEGWKAPLNALNELRSGNIHAATEDWPEGWKAPDVESDAADDDFNSTCEVPEYDRNNPEPFFLAMGALSSYLKDIGT